MNIQQFSPKRTQVPIVVLFPTIPDWRTQAALMDTFDRSGVLFKFASNQSDRHCELFRVQTSKGRAMAGFVVASPADDLPMPGKPSHRAAGQIVLVCPFDDISTAKLRELRDTGLLDAEGYADCMRLKADPLSHVDGWDYDEGKPVEPCTSISPMNFAPKL